jgi:hypothetical protein
MREGEWESIHKGKITSYIKEREIHEEFYRVKFRIINKAQSERMTICNTIHKAT